MACGSGFGLICRDSDVSVIVRTLSFRQSATHYAESVTAIELTHLGKEHPVENIGWLECESLAHSIGLLQLRWNFEEDAGESTFGIMVMDISKPKGNVSREALGKTRRLEPKFCQARGIDSALKVLDELGNSGAGSDRRPVKFGIAL
jgi:hypothetical protein